MKFWIKNFLFFVLLVSFFVFNLNNISAQDTNSSDEDTLDVNILFDTFIDNIDVTNNSSLDLSGQLAPIIIQDLNDKGLLSRAINSATQCGLTVSDLSSRVDNIISKINKLGNKESCYQGLFDFATEYIRNELESSEQSTYIENFRNVLCTGEDGEDICNLLDSISDLLTSGASLGDNTEEESSSSVDRTNNKVEKYIPEELNVDEGSEGYKIPCPNNGICTFDQGLATIISIIEPALGSVFGVSAVVSGGIYMDGRLNAKPDQLALAQTAGLTSIIGAIATLVFGPAITQFLLGGTLI